MGDKKCLYCGKKLIDNTWYCNIDCERKDRINTDELYILLNDGTTISICPIIDFTETDSELIVNNGSGIYTTKKLDIKKWKIDKCSCCQEFMNVDYGIKES